MPAHLRKLFAIRYWQTAKSEKLTAKSGFTLVELLVVITIIAILSVIGITVFTGIQKGARESAKKADIDAISKAYEAKYGNNSVYPILTGADFASGKIPTPDGTTNTSYFVAGPNVSGGSNNNFMVCASLVDNNQCFANSSTCFCKTSSQGEPITDTFSIGNPVTNGSFETDSNGDGLADNWTSYGTVTTTISQSPAPRDGQFVQKTVAERCCFVGIKQTITGLKPSTTYKQTGWMYMESGHGACGSVGVGMQGAGGETFVGCNRPDQWVQLTLTGNSDASGNYYTGFQNWTDNAYFYVDSVRLEEVK